MVDSSSFPTEASQVLTSLRSSIAGVISSLGDIRKPADLQKLLQLDWTLSWQLFQVAGVNGGDAISSGSVVPSRTSLKKFLDTAKAHGVAEGKLENAWSDYERFERLVKTHAGDRTSFNSMVSAAGGLDADWLAADLQHRRNAFRAMSHVTGMQAKSKVICGIFNDAADLAHWDFAVLVGFVHLRVLRTIESNTVFRMRTYKDSREFVTREPLGLSDQGMGFLLSEFSSNPMPQLDMTETDAGWLIGSVKHHDVGNRGASTMMFGTVFRHHPVPTPTDEPFNSDVFIDKPVEVIISDALIKPGLMRDMTPRPLVFLGNNMTDRPDRPGDTIPIEGSYSLEMIGRGPNALATPDVPHYPDMLAAAGEKLGWPVHEFEAWRLRIEFPIYQSTIRIEWSRR
ncbi:MAG: hypothetical protein QM770_06950 [Tepidisphaeraceae bacterium]